MKKYLFSFISLFIILSCEDNTPRTNVPYAPVNFTIFLNSYDNILNIPFQYKTFTEKDKRIDGDRFGYAGLLVVADATGNAIYAYDLCCPYEGNVSIKVTPKDGGKAECLECGSVYITFFGSLVQGRGMVGLGSPESGPAATEKLSLKSYSVLPLQNGELRITN